MEISEYWTLDACSRKLSVFDACYALALRRRVQCSTEISDKRNDRRRDSHATERRAEPSDGPAVRPDQTHLNAVQVTT